MSLEEWKTIFEIAGLAAILATFGCAFGAWYFARAVNTVQAEQLRQFDKGLMEGKTELAKQQLRAADAEKQLKDVDTKTEGFRLAIAQANERAAKAEESLALAEQHAAEANSKAEEFRLDIAKANERAAEANRIAEQERLARLQLEERLADRTLLPIQEQQLRAAFARLKGKTVGVLVFGDTMEITQFSGKIMACMRDVGVVLNVHRPLGAASARGVLVGVRADAPPEFKQAAEDLISILRLTIGDGVGPWEFDKLTTGGIAAGSNDQGATPNSPLRVAIGSK